VTGGPGSTANFTDTADGGRIAISGFNGTSRTLATFAPGFGVDYAISIENGFAGLFATTLNGSHIFQNSVGIGLTGNNTAPSYTVQFPLINIGITPGETFSLVGTLISSSAFRSDETFVNPASLNAGFGGNVTWSNSASYTVIPEPSIGLMMLSGFGFLAWFRKWRA